MVFCCFRTIHKLAGQLTAIFVRIVIMFWSMSHCLWSKRSSKTNAKNNSAIFTVFTSGGNRNDPGLCASFTIEATLVLGVLFMSIALLSQYAYIQHDKITGTIILEEMLVRSRRDLDGEYSEKLKNLRKIKLYLLCLNSQHVKQKKCRQSQHSSFYFTFFFFR